MKDVVSTLLKNRVTSDLRRGTTKSISSWVSAWIAITSIEHVALYEFTIKMGTY